MAILHHRIPTLSSIFARPWLPRRSLADHPCAAPAALRIAATAMNLAPAVSTKRAPIRYRGTGRGVQCVGDADGRGRVKLWDSERRRRHHAERGDGAALAPRAAARPRWIPAVATEAARRRSPELPHLHPAKILLELELRLANALTLASSSCRSRSSTSWSAFFSVSEASYSQSISSAAPLPYPFPSADEAPLRGGCAVASRECGLSGRGSEACVPESCPSGLGSRSPPVTQSEVARRLPHERHGRITSWLCALARPSASDALTAATSPGLARHSARRPDLSRIVSTNTSYVGSKLMPEIDTSCNSSPGESSY